MSGFGRPAEGFPGARVSTGPADDRRRVGGDGMLALGNPARQAAIDGGASSSYIVRGAHPSTQTIG